MGNAHRGGRGVSGSSDVVAGRTNEVAGGASTAVGEAAGKAAGGARAGGVASRTGEADAVARPCEATGHADAIAVSVAAALARRGGQGPGGYDKVPLLEADRAVYFLTLRLADALPRSLELRLPADRRAVSPRLRAHAGALAKPERSRTRGAPGHIVEMWLDRGCGSCLLANPTLAAAVAATLRRHDGKRYRLLGWCVMPSHVHVLFSLPAGRKPAPIVRAWKNDTARAAHRLLRRDADFWHAEDSTHLLESSREVWRTLHYIADNPRRGRLQNWPWLEIRHPAAAP